MKKEIFCPVRDIIKLFEGGQKANFEELNILKGKITKHLQNIWRGKILEEDKLTSEEIFDDPLTVAYLLYCYPVQLIAVVQEKEMLLEYWDFYLENFPELQFNNDLEEFYDFLKLYYGEY